MKVGIQTIVWEDARIRGDVTRRDIFRQAKDAGYDGVELFESPRLIQLAELDRDLKDFDLELTGLTGGSFAERLDLARKWRADKAIKRPVPYLYCDQKRTPAIIDALKDRFSVALHPHMFKPVQTVAEAEEMLQSCRREVPNCDLHLMFDTAHLYIAGDDILAAIKKHLREIKCIHIKDWTPEFGKSYQFYARGFVPLGKGDVSPKISAVIEHLTLEKYDGWLIVEVDHPDNPVAAAKESSEYLGTLNIKTRT